MCALSAFIACGSGGCESRSPSDSDQPAARRTSDADLPARNDWRVIDDSPQVALPADFDDEALAAAIARAQETAGEARRRWLATPPGMRQGWAIRWAAPTAEGGIEYLWVDPVNWSRHRVEGRLANPPQRELACGKGLDQLVSFPVEQLADWISAADADPSPADTARHGGFTVRLLEDRYGRTTPSDTDGP
jgi:uncharacterized protein YegJ (DUF2314 family)